MLAAPGITVNETFIPSDQIAAEVQYYPAASLPEARYQAMEALVIRALLIQRARAAGLWDDESEPEEAGSAIERLLDQDIETPDPSAEECARYVAHHRNKFRTAPLFEVSHILYAAPPSDPQARVQARARAEEALRQVRADPSCFAALARRDSACSSGAQGGCLGQIGKGQTLPAFEEALFEMREGEISCEPVETEVGFHLLRVDRRVEGQAWPEEMALEWVAAHLKKKAWMTAFHRYVRMLAACAKISGFRFREGDSPLIR